MVLLLAQLVAPPLQRGPVRLPTPVPQAQPGDQPAPVLTPTPEEVEPAPERPQPPEPERPQPPEAPGPEPAGSQQIPEIRGATPYPPSELQRLLGPCSALPDRAERLRACALALSARLVADGYINTRVYDQPTPEPGYLEVVEGRLVELRVQGSDAALNARVQRWLDPLRGQVLHLPSLEARLQLVQRRTEVAQVRANLSRLGSDPARGVFTVTVTPAAAQPWRGDFSLRNEGSNGSGEARFVGGLVKEDLARRGDALLLYGELVTDTSPAFGSVVSSISYTLPLSEPLSVTGAFGYSRRNLIELPAPVNGLSTSQYQGLAQLDWRFRDGLDSSWSAFVGLSSNRSNLYLNDRALPADQTPLSVRSPQSGYLRLGVQGSGFSGRVGWSGTAYLLQGIGGMTPAAQRQELALAGIVPGQASALAGLLSVAWSVAPRWQLNLRAAGQVAFQRLTDPMQFSLGSDTGIRGLPSQLVSGDSGWLGTAEVVWTAWQNDRQALQVVPFIGAGGVRTIGQVVTFRDNVGAGGLLARWLQGDQWTFELGWVHQFQTDDDVGSWQDWTLAKGLYAKVGYRF
jgi:hemolysin activation/secretion protein